MTDLERERLADQSLLGSAGARGAVAGDVEGARAPSMLAAAHRSLGPALLRRKIARRRASRREADAQGIAPGASAALATADGSSGTPLPQPLAQRFEASLGADLGGVRLHTGEASSIAAKAVSARAYTVGSDIHFGAGQYDPSSAGGQHLLAHEVAHTVQQGGQAPAAPGSAQFQLEVSTPGDASEVEADRAADAMVVGGPASLATGPAGPALKRSFLDDLWEGAKSVGSAVAGAASAVGGAVAGAASAVGGAVAGAASAVGGAVTGAAKAVGGAISGAASAVGGAVTSAAEWIYGVFAGHPDGIVTSDVPASGAAPKLPAGTAVHVYAYKMSGELAVDVFSGLNTRAIIPRSVFKEEPGVLQKSDSDPAKRDDVYEQYTGQLWGADGPKAQDAYVQRSLGDCYLMASMGAVAGANPGAIKKLFAPQSAGATSYSVTIYEKDLLGKLVPKQYPVDNWLPTLKASPHTKAYAEAGASALWPAFLEKAYAMHMGSYQKANGGWAADSLEAITGVPSEKVNEAGTDGKGGGLLDQFRKLQKENKAVTLATKTDPNVVQHNWTPALFAQSGSTFTATLGPLAFGSVFLADASSAKKFQAKDDNNAGVTQTGGGASLTAGSVDYITGKVTLTFAPGAQPDAAANIQVWYKNQSADYAQYKIVGPHVYHFVGMREPDAILLKNPWGHQDPNPIDAGCVARNFNEIATSSASRVEEAQPSPP